MNRPGFEDRYELWLKEFESYKTKHGLTTKQAVSVLFRDDAYNQNDPEKDLVTRKSLFDWVEVVDFFYHLEKQ